MQAETIKVEGLNENIDKLNRLLAEQPRINQNILRRVGNFMADQMRHNAHVWTGRMKGSINVESLTDKAVVVAVPVPYARIENERPGTKAAMGTHDFATRAKDATMREFPVIIKEEYDRFVSTL